MGLEKILPKLTSFLPGGLALNTGDLPCNIGKDVVSNNTGLSLDTILEKIFSQGLGALTMEEVNFLGEISKDL
jgi:hypothetical protein